MTKKTTKPEEMDPRNAQVKTLREHSNAYGEKFIKAKGDVYTHPRPAADIASGVVSLDDGETKAPIVKK